MSDDGKSLPTRGFSLGNCVWQWLTDDAEQMILHMCQWSVVSGWQKWIVYALEKNEE